MADHSEKRPDFFEGQYLGADDLDTLVTYVRNQQARHALGAHSWGVASGLELIEQTGTAGEKEVYVLPGYAVDGYGRGIVVANPCRLSLDLFQGQATGAVPLWLRYDEAASQGTRSGFEVCDASDQYARVLEGFELEVGWFDDVVDRQSGVTVAGEAVVDAREAARLLDENGPLICDAAVPHQELPRPEDSGRWLIPLGLVGWQSGGSGAFVALGDEQRLESRRLRRYLGVVAESLLAPDGVIRLRDRKATYIDGVATEDQCEADAIGENDVAICNDKPEAKELIWLEGRVRAKGDVRLYGARLELRDAAGTGYSEDEEGTPLLVQRLDSNERKGVDLQILVGQSDEGINRVAIGQVTATQDEATCATTFAVTNRVIVQDDGKVGVGTNLPDQLVTVEGTDSAFINVRTAGAAHELKLGVDEDGAIVSAVSDDPLHLRAGGDTTVMTITAEGDVGIGTTTPDAKLDVTAVRTTSGGSALGRDKWIQAGNGDDSGRFWIEYGSQAAPLLVLSDKDDPPRIQFQQLGDGAEDAPDFSSYIGHATGSSTDLALMSGRVGVGTESPFVELTVAGSLGFKSSSAPMIYVFESGGSGERMILAHSPGQPERGISYLASTNAVLFKNGGSTALAVDLTDGLVGVGTSSPQAELDVRGDVKLGDAGELFAPGAPQNLRLVAGSVSSAGARTAGEGFSCARDAEGRYTVTFDTNFPSAPMVVATPIASSDDDHIVTVRAVTSSGFQVRMKDATPSEEGTLQDTAFSFVVFGGRS